MVAALRWWRSSNSHASVTPSRMPTGMAGGHHRRRRGAATAAGRRCRRSRQRAAIGRRRCGECRQHLPSPAFARIAYDALGCSRSAVDAAMPPRSDLVARAPKRTKGVVARCNMGSVAFATKVPQQRAQEGTFCAGSPAGRVMRLARRRPGRHGPWRQPSNEYPCGLARLPSARWHAKGGDGWLTLPFGMSLVPARRRRRAPLRRPPRPT